MKGPGCGATPWTGLLVYTASCPLFKLRPLVRTLKMGLGSGCWGGVPVSPFSNVAIRSTACFSWLLCLAGASVLLWVCESLCVTHLVAPTSPGLKQPDRPSAAAALLCVLFCGFSACAFGWQQPGVGALVDISAAESISSSLSEGVGCCVQPMLLSLPFSGCTCSALSGLLPSHAQISLKGPSGVLYFRDTQPLPPADVKCSNTQSHREHFTLKQQRTKFSNRVSDPVFQGRRQE